MSIGYVSEYEYKGFKLGQIVKYKRYDSDKKYTKGKIIGFNLDKDAIFPIYILTEYKDVTVKDRIDFIAKNRVVMLHNVDNLGFCCVKLELLKPKIKTYKYKDYILEVKKIMSIWKDSFINSKFELILEKRRNIYINLNMYTTPRELKYNMLCWKSRPCIKGDDDKYLYAFREKFNKYFNQNWTLEDIDLIYQRFGNEVNSKLCYKFIDSEYDMGVLR